jgi:ABC-type polysaccharide/polyol phosphate export permease
MSVIFNSIRAWSGNISGHVTTISFLTSPIYYKLQNATLADENSVFKINPDIHLMYEVPATVNVYRAKCSLSDADYISSQTILRTVS